MKVVAITNTRPPKDRADQNTYKRLLIANESQKPATSEPMIEQRINGHTVDVVV